MRTEDGIVAVGNNVFARLAVSYQIISSTTEHVLIKLCKVIISVPGGCCSSLISGDRKMSVTVKYSSLEVRFNVVSDLSDE